MDGNITAFPIDEASSTLGVAWVDFDNDGDLDLYYANAGTASDPDRIFRNLGAGLSCKFNGPPSVTSKVCFSWIDYDADGDQDLFLGRSSTQPNQMWENDGTGSFSLAVIPELELAAAHTESAQWADYDGDGYLDVFLANSAGDNTLLRGQAGGGFVDATTPALATAVCANSNWIDHDNDGDLDLFLAGGIATQNANSILFLNSGGVLWPSTPPGLGHATVGGFVTWGDYDNDGDLDAYFCPRTGTSFLMRNVAGVFTSGSTAGVDGVSNIRAACWIDLDLDGHLDLAVSNGYTRTYMNNGDGTFTAHLDPWPERDGWVWSMSFGDFNGDSAPDVVLGAGLNRSNVVARNEARISIFQTFLKVTLEGVQAHPVAHGARIRAVIRDNSPSETNPPFTQTRDFSFQTNGTSQNAPEICLGLTKGWSLALAEMESMIINWPSGLEQVVDPIELDQVHHIREDWFVDYQDPLLGNFGSNLIWGHWFSTDNDLLDLSGPATRFLNADGLGGFTDMGNLGLIVNQYTAGGLWFNMDPGTFFGDVCTWGVNGLQLFEGQSGVGFVEIADPDFQDPTGTSGVAWGDYDEDGDMDAYVCHQEGKLLRNDGGTFTDVTTPMLQVPSQVATWVDYDNDQDLDLVVAGGNLGGNWTFRNDGQGNFVEPYHEYHPEPFTRAMDWGDYDNDGDLDLLLARGGPNRLFRNDPLGFTMVDIPENSGANGASFVDVDLDGRLDLHLPGGTGGQLLRNEGGDVFRDVSGWRIRSDGGGAGGWADYDSDGDPDLATQTPSRILTNDRDRLGNENNWVKVMIALGNLTGSRVLVTSTAGTQMREISVGNHRGGSNGGWEIFGVGDAQVVDIEIQRWNPGNPKARTSIFLPNQPTNTAIEVDASTSVADEGLPPRLESALLGNYPNPFNPATTLRFRLDRDTHVKLDVFTIRGQKVATLVDGTRTVGEHTVAWRGVDDSGQAVASGVYVARLALPGFTQSHRMTLVR